MARRAEFQAVEANVAHPVGSVRRAIASRSSFGTSPLEWFVYTP